MITDTLKNFSVFVDGRGLLGKVDEFTLPKLTVKTEDHRAAGMDAPAAIDLGMEKLEAGFKLAGVDAETLKLFGVTYGLPSSFMLRGALQDDSGLVTPVTVILRGRVKEIDFGTWKPGDKAQVTVGLSLRFYQFTHGVQPIHVIDVDNMVRIINGFDQLAAIRLAIGA